MRLLRLCLAVFVLSLAAPAAATVTSIPARPVRVLCDALSTSNVASKSGPQTVDSISLVAGKVACLVAQSDNKNGPYLVQSGAWKAIDPGLGTGVELYALAGSSNANRLYGCDTTGAITWGTTSVTFTLKSSSGTTFNPANPGAIGSTSTPAASVTTYYVDLPDNLGMNPTAAAGHLKLFRPTTGDIFTLQAGTGDVLAFYPATGSGTSIVQKRFYVKSLTNGATFDIATSVGGYGVATAPGATGSTSCAFSFAANAATTDNGLTGTNCAVADTGSKLCAFASGGNLRIKNNLGTTQTVLIELTLAVAP